MGTPHGLSTVERFLQNVPHQPEGGCWEWHGARNDHGYGVFHIRKDRGIAASRAAYILFVAKHYLRGRLQVCHRCDNPPCVNPSHLFLATAKGNQQDSIVKGRRPKTNPKLRKLTDGQRAEILHRYPSETTRQLAAVFGVSRECIRLIILQHLPQPAPSIRSFIRRFGAAALSKS